MGERGEQPFVAIRNLEFAYPGGPVVLRIPAFSISEPGLLALRGDSGSGKSTLVELLAGTLHEPYKGSIQVLGHEMKDLADDADRQRHIRTVGLIPQDFSLLSGWTVKEILWQDLADAQFPATERDKRISQALAEVELSDVANRPCQRLSGGQRHRIAIARMLARNVQLAIADEPTGDLNRDLARTILDLLGDLAERKSIPVIVVTHDHWVAEQCDKQVLLPLLSPPADGSIEIGLTPPDSTQTRRRYVVNALRLALVLLALCVTVLFSLPLDITISGPNAVTTLLPFVMVWVVLVLVALLFIVCLPIDVTIATRRPILTTLLVLLVLLAVAIVLLWNLPLTIAIHTSAFLGGRPLS